MDNQYPSNQNPPQRPDPRRLAFMIISLSCITAIGVCVIVNLAVQGELTWALFPIYSIVLAWAVTAPALLLQRGQIAASLLVLTVLLLPYLFLLNGITPDPDWFLGLGLPLAGVGIAAAWLCYFVLNKLKCHGLYASALLVFITGVAANPAISEIILAFTGEERNYLSTFIPVFVCLVVSIGLAIGGYARGKRTHTGN